MSILDVSNLTQGFGERTIFQSTDLKLLRGEHMGLVGNNGEGKSTFLKLITGNILPDEGTIKWSGNVSYGYLDQNVELTKDKTVRQVLRTAYDYLYNKENQLNDLYIKVGELQDKELEKALKKIGTIQEFLDKNNFYGIESNIEAISDGLGFRELLDRETTSLSGGQRIKVLLGKLLLEKPDVLLLDEPTNHLDEENIHWLRNYLNNYEKAFILICHDNSFINSVVNVIYHLENKVLTRYPGNYDKFRKLYEERKIQNQIAYERQQKEIQRLETFIRKNKARASTTGLAQSREKQLN
ncbi:MAG: ATP-binding cassette domain-containing protein, partial [Clostridiaceae bacterium]|nr:ATP-binding cassette domain-containing protein [Clostridiaceae bacterium]